MAVKTLKVGSNYEDKLSFLSEAEMMKRFEHRVGTFFLHMPLNKQKEILGRIRSCRFLSIFSSKSTL